MVQGGKQCVGRNSPYATPKTWESVWDFGSALLRASEQAIGTGEGLRRFEQATLCTSGGPRLQCVKRSKIREELSWEETSGQRLLRSQHTGFREGSGFPRFTSSPRTQVTENCTPQAGDAEESARRLRGWMSRKVPSSPAREEELVP